MTGFLSYLFARGKQPVFHINEYTLMQHMRDHATRFGIDCEIGVALDDLVALQLDATFTFNFKSLIVTFNSTKVEVDFAPEEYLRGIADLAARCGIAPRYSEPLGYACSVTGLPLDAENVVLPARLGSRFPHRCAECCQSRCDYYKRVLVSLVTPEGKLPHMDEMGRVVVHCAQRQRVGGVWRCRTGVALNWSHKCVALLTAAHSAPGVLVESQFVLPDQEIVCNVHDASEEEACYSFAVTLLHLEPFDMTLQA